MNTKLIALASGALLTAAALAGCTAGSSGDDGAGSMPGMNHTSHTAQASDTDHNQADVTFAMNMVAHHQQAIEMSDMLLAKQGVDPRVAELAQAIKAAQQPEIDTMNGWLTGWGQKGGMDDMAMGDGMMSQHDMAALKNASAADASKLFLTQMIQHHQGAIEMATTESETGRATEAIALATKIVTAQTAEIAAMKDLLARL